MLALAFVALAVTTVNGSLITLIGAAIAATGSITAAFVTVRLMRKVQEVHVLVNSNLAELKQELARVVAERDHLDPARPDS